MADSWGWIGVDLDGTLATYAPGDFKRHGPCHIGEPIPRMVARVIGLLNQGETVKIFTARASDPDPEVIPAIKAWCLKHLGVELEVTNVKDFEMKTLYDDRAIQVRTNTGWIVE